MDPADAVAASFVGHVRRVVLDDDGLIINLGRRSRIFVGRAREAACCRPPTTTMGDVCGPGCRHHRCHVDHSTEWTAGGVTDQRNAGPLCPRHNRFESRGYRCWRDPTGVWHIVRPDGTEIKAA